MGILDAQQQLIKNLRLRFLRRKSIFVCILLLLLCFFQEAFGGECSACEKPSVNNCECASGLEAIDGDYCRPSSGNIGFQKSKGAVGGLPDADGDCLADRCVTNADCDDGVYSNGMETCDANNGCKAGTPPILDDGEPCTNDLCDEVNDIVLHLPDNAFCDDGLYCNGMETCDANNGCKAGTPPILDDGEPCTSDSCDEVNDIVLHLPDDALCDDSVYCNGMETCNANTGCEPGTPPILDDNIACTIDSCDEVNDVVLHDITTNFDLNTSEICSDNLDNNCNGSIDEGCPVCGNGTLETGEGCDDGNTTNGDGCSSTCVVEVATVTCPCWLDENVLNQYFSNWNNFSWLPEDSCEDANFNNITYNDADGTSIKLIYKKQDYFLSMSSCALNSQYEIWAIVSQDISSRFCYLRVYDINGDIVNQPISGITSQQRTVCESTLSNAINNN